MSTFQMSKENFNLEVLQSKEPVIVDFWAPWCGPCRMVSPLLEELSEEMPQYKFVKVNVDEQPELASSFRVSSIPTLMFFQDGNLLDMVVGAMTKNAFKDRIQTVFSENDVKEGSQAQ